jgi:hypothetical protein
MKTQKPIHEVRLGLIKSAVWKNETENGVRYNVTFRRLYKDGDAWKSIDSFGGNDLLLLSKVANETHSWICAQNQDRQNPEISPEIEADERSRRNQAER